MRKSLLSLCLVLSRLLPSTLFVSSNNDYIIVSSDVVFTDIEGRNITALFELNYNQLCHWREAVHQFVVRYSPASSDTVDTSVLEQYVVDKLQILSYDTGDNGSVSSTADLKAGTSSNDGGWSGRPGVALNIEASSVIASLDLLQTATTECVDSLTSVFSVHNNNYDSKKTIKNRSNDEVASAEEGKKRDSRKTKRGGSLLLSHLRRIHESTSDVDCNPLSDIRFLFEDAEREEKRKRLSEAEPVQGREPQEERQVSGKLSSFPSYLITSGDRVARYGANDGNSPVSYKNASRIMIYTSSRSVTGGTIALELLHERLLSLGYNSILCSSLDFGHDDNCNGTLTDNDLLVTGEWCAGVKNDFGILDFSGRGLQYHLGFHHDSGYCRGHVTIADSHFLSSSLSHRIMGAYYLGCPMTNLMRTTFLDLLRKGSEFRPIFFNSTRDEATDEGQQSFVSSCGNTVQKENLVVIDPDISIDYPPENTLRLDLPSSVKVVYAQNIPRSQMPLLLQRAKVVVDLAMPGPERLAGEGVLLGAIPIVSNRWNGASPVDFPGIRKVDHQNASAISDAILSALRNFYPELRSKNNAVFYRYILSLWRRIHHTVDVVFGSSYVHFVVSAHSLAEEHEACFQVLALFFLYPLASVTILVEDSKWFMRHHYTFYSMLRQAGYVRNDIFEPYDPHSMGDIPRADGLSRSFVSIKSFKSFLQTCLICAQRSDLTSYDTNKVSSSECMGFLPGAMVVSLSSGFIFADSGALQMALKASTIRDIRRIVVAFNNQHSVNMETITIDTVSGAALHNTQIAHTVHHVDIALTVSPMAPLIPSIKEILARHLPRQLIPAELQSQTTECGDGNDVGRYAVPEFVLPIDRIAIIDLQCDDRNTCTAGVSGLERSKEGYRRGMHEVSDLAREESNGEALSVQFVAQSVPWGRLCGHWSETGGK